MEQYPTPGPDPEPPAPVAGGIRWRSRYRDLLDLQRREMRLKQTDDPDGEGSPARQEPAPELTEDGAPHISSTPVPEARADEEYVYQPRAFDGNVSGFTWYFEKSPPGMAVDRHTGRVAWTPSEGGVVEVVLCARSLYGKTARQCWTLCVRKAAAVRTPTPNNRFTEALRRKGVRSGRIFRIVWRDGRRRLGEGRRATAPPTTTHPVAIPLRR